MHQNIALALFSFVLLMLAMAGAPANKTTPKPIPVRDADCFVHRLHDPTFREERNRNNRRGKRR